VLRSASISLPHCLQIAAVSLLTLGWQIPISPRVRFFARPSSRSGSSFLSHPGLGLLFQYSGSSGSPHGSPVGARRPPETSATRYPPVLHPAHRAVVPCVRITNGRRISSKRSSWSTLGGPVVSATLVPYLLWLCGLIESSLVALRDRGLATLVGGQPTRRRFQPMGLGEALVPL